MECRIRTLSRAGEWARGPSRSTQHSQPRVHGTGNYAQLLKPANQICLDCHGPLALNGPRTATIAEHTHHKEGSPGSECVACHMPAIETTIADVKVHAHTFRFISPEMSDKY